MLDYLLLDREEEDIKGCLKFFLFTPVGLIITGTVLGIAGLESGINQKITNSSVATIIESCDRSPDCQNYFKHPPAPPPQVAKLPNSSEYTPQTWAITLLSSMGYNTTSGIDLRVVEDWEAEEGGHWQNTASFNPLNTTQQEPGSHSINTVGVQAYTSWEEGFQATITTLNYSAYLGIRQQLASNNCESCLINAIVSSPWGTKHIGA